MGSAPRSIQSLLHTATPDMADLLGRARFLTRIRASILDILPEQAVDHVRVAAYENYRLRLHVAHASWATRLRYMAPAISQTLARRLQLHVDAVDVKVRAETHAPSPRNQPRFVSPASRAHIRQVARYIDDTSLAAALERLATAGDDRRTRREEHTKPPPPDAR